MARKCIKGNKMNMDNKRINLTNKINALGKILDDSLKSGKIDDNEIKKAYSDVSFWMEDLNSYEDENDNDFNYLENDLYTIKI